jgi:hypothetical protein
MLEFLEFDEKGLEAKTSLFSREASGFGGFFNENEFIFHFDSHSTRTGSMIFDPVLNSCRSEITPAGWLLVLPGEGRYGRK